MLTKTSLGEIAQIHAYLKITCSNLNALQTIHLPHLNTELGSGGTGDIPNLGAVRSVYYAANFAQERQEQKQCGTAEGERVYNRFYVRRVIARFVSGKHLRADTEELWICLYTGQFR